MVLPQVLEHMPDPDKVLDEALRVLRVGGHVVLSARNMTSAYGSLWSEVESKGQIPIQGPFTPLDAADIQARIATRFTIEEAFGIGRDATGDAEKLTGDATLSGRLYALRARKA